MKAYGDGLKKDGLSINDVDAEFFVDVSEAGVGPLKVEISTPQGLNLHSKVEYDEGKKIYTYKYTPGEDGEYTIKVIWCGKHIPNSPFKVSVVGSKRPRAATLTRASTLGGAAAVAAQYKIYGPGIESKTLSALAPAEFWVEGVAVGSKLQVKITGPKGALSSSAYAVESMGKGKFSAVYRPPCAGQYKIDISVGGKPTALSPYTVTIAGVKPKIIGWARGPGVDGIDLQASKQTWFKVFTPAASNRDVVVNIEDSNKNKVNVSCSKTIDGVFKYTYTPKGNGTYCIAVLVGPKKTQQRLNFSVIVPTAPVKGPCKVWGPGIAPRGIQVGRPSYIYARPVKPEDKKAIVVAVTGPDGTIPVTNDEGPDNIRTFTFEPTKVGPYTVSVAYGEEAIPDFPVNVSVTDASKVELTGPGINGEPIPVNKAVCIEVDLAEAGPGKLNCQLLAIESPNQKDADKFVAEMAPKIIDKGNGKAEIQFTPKLTCQPTLLITFDDVPIRQSPLKLNAMDKRPAKVFGRGIRDGVAAKKPTYFMVDTKDCGQGSLKVDIAGPQKPIIKTSIIKGKEIYKCEYMPKAKGDYSVEVIYDDLPAEGSPFKLKVLDGKTSQVFAVYGPAVEKGLTVGSPADFYYDTGDTPVNEAAVMIETPTTEATPVLEPIDDKITKCSFTPQEPGRYKMGVKADGKPVPGSPFTASATFPEGLPKVVAMGEGLEKAYVDEWANFSLDYSEAGPGSVGVSIDGPQNVETKVEKQKDKKALVKYLPSKKGEYELNVTFSDQGIPGSPFKVKAIPREEGATKVVQLEAEGVKLGNNFVYMVDASAKPKDPVNGRIIGPFVKESAIPKDVLSNSTTLKKFPKLAIGKKTYETDVTRKGKNYEIGFTPKEVGVYVLYVFVGDTLAPKMPHKIFVCDPSKIIVTGCGLKDQDKSVDVGKPLTWKADCRKAGPGTLKAYCGGPNNCSEKFVITLLPTQNDCYTVEYVPDLPGSYQILFAYSGYDLTDKPVIMVGDSSKAQVQASDVRTCLVGEEVSFKIDLSAAGAGKLQASLEGPAEVPLSFAKNNDGSCNFSFTPSEVGKFALSVSFGDKKLTDKPLEVIAINPEKVKVSGPGANGKGASVGEPTEVIVDRTDAGIAPVEGVLSTPSGEKQPLDFKPTNEDEPDVLAATYTPDETGNYQLDLTFDGKPIKDSPFTAKITDSPKLKGPGLESGAIGEENIIDVFMPAIVPEEVTMEMMAPDHQEIPFEYFVDKIDDNHCQVKYIPEKCEVCECQLAYAGAPLGDPFKIPIGDPSKCKVSGLGIEDGKLPVGKEKSITVDSTEAGPGVPKVVITGPNDSKVEPVCTEEKPGVNKFNYTPEKGGPHEVAVLFGGHDVPGSPYSVPVCNPAGVKCAPVNPGEKKYHPGEEIVLAVDLKDAGEGDFSLGLVGPDNRPIVSEEAFITIVPIEEAPIDGNTETFELKPEGPKVGTTFPYRIDTSGVQTGDKISGKVVGPFKNKKKVPKELLSDKITLQSLPTVTKDQPVIQPDVKENNKVYDVNFTPEKVGVYPLYIFLGDNLVNNMPSLISVCDADEVKITGPGLDDTENNTYPINTPLVWEADCTTAGPGKLTAFCAGPDDCSKKFKVAPVPGKPDCYTVTYKPKKAGPYQVLFAFGGYEITKKPTFSVSKPSFAALLFGKLTTDGVKPVGEPIEGNISQTKNDDGTYKFGFVPDKPGLYEFAPTVSDNPVFEEPLCILVTDPEKVKVSGPGATGKGACVGKPTEVIVDRTAAGPAPVEGVLSAPSGKKQPLDFKPKDEDKPDVLAATYTPDKPGNYQLDVTFDGEPIKDSPITAKVLGSGECRFEGPGLESGAIGEENIIDVFMPAIVPEEVTMEMMAPDHQEIPFEFFVDKIDDDHCEVRFIPETCEVCEGQLAYAGAPLGDPFKIPVGDPSKCKVSGPGIEDDKLPVGKGTSFTVDSTEAGPGVPKVVITGPNDSKVEPVCTEEKPGVNKFTYTPEKGGPHEVAVLFGGHNVPGSPYSVPVCNPAGVKCAPVNPGEKKYHPGEEIVLAVDLKDAGEGDFSLGLVGPGNSPIVSEEAFIAIVPIEEAPIDGNTETFELKPEGPKVGATFPYCIDTSGVQTGDKISGKVVGPFKNKKKVPKELLSDKITLQSLPTVTKDQPVIEPDVKENKKVYDVNFTPEIVGVYPLYIFLGDNLVNDMPSLISVCDADEVKITGPGLDDTESNTYPINTPLVWEADCTTAGPGKLTAFCAGPDDCSKKFKVAPVPGKPDCYTVTYKPKKAGPYQVLFAFGGYEITKKPTFSVSKPSFAALLFGKLTTDDTTDGVKPVGEPIEGNISQTKNDDGTYKFGFVPDKPGLYEFAPTVSDNPVFEEPLCILVTDPEKVKVSGPGATGKGACVGKPTEVVVDRTEAGPAPVEGVLSTPSGEKQPLDFKPKDEDKPDVLAATYTPDKPGNYQLDVTFDGEPIKDSPITAKVLDSSECRFEGPGLESGAIGEENIIDVFMPAIVPEEVTMEMMAPDHQEIPFEFFVDKIDDDHCQVRFIPETCEVCEGQLAYAGAPLGDPFKIPVGDPSKCKVSGPGIEDDKLPVGKETSFTVDSTEAGPGVPKVVITGPNDSKVEPVCTEEKPGVNKYTYTPEKGGPHEVAVLFGGHDIPGSPYTVPVCNPAGVKCAPVNPGEKKYHPGEEIVLAVDLKDAGEGDFSLGLVGPDNRPIVSEEAFIAIVPIEEAPIDGNTETFELKPEGPNVGTTFPYSIDTSGVQTGDKISGKVVGPFKNKKKVPKELLSDKITLQSLPTVTKDQPVIQPDVKENNKVYDVNFTPEKVGVYPLYIFLGDNLVSDMPSLISVCDADEVKITGPGLDDTENNTYPINTPLVWEADCTTAGPGKLTAFCAGPDDCSKKFKVAPVPGKRDCYTVTYKPKKAGPYQVLFAFGGYEITKKPTFSVSKPSFAALLFGKLTTDDTTNGTEPVKPVGEPIEGNISQTKNDDGTYKFGFVPDKPGLYEFAPTVSDNPVFEEPLCILVTNPEKVKVSGPGATGRGACVGKPTEVVVDRTEAGPAPVEGVLSTPSGEKQPLDFKPKDEDKPDVLAATYTPDKPGNYQLDVTFDGEPIKDSPITAKVLDSSECRFEGPGLESGAIGEENIIDVFMPAIVPEEVTMEMMAPDHQAIPFEFFVDKIDDDHCQVRFIPETCEVCEGQLAYAGAPLGDPFKIPVGDPSKCKVGGPGIEDDKLPVGKETSFTVDSTEAGPGVPKVVITGPNDSKVEPVCTEEKPGVNKYTYTPEKGGPHEVAVLFGGHDIPGSPYTVPVCNPAGVKCAPVNPGEKKYHPGEEIVLAVDLKDAGEGDFSLGLVGPDNRPIVSEEAFIAIVPIEEAPIDGNTEIVELKPEGPKVGATVPYSIDTSGVQTGDKISGKVVGPFKNKKKVPKELLSDKITLQSLPTVTKDQPVIEPDVKENNKVYDVNFTPEKVGVYPLYIFLGDNLVNDMPSLISVCDADEVKITGPGLDDTESNTYPINTPLVWEADCTTAGPGKLTAFCAGPDDCSKKFKVAPVPGKRDCYTVTYKPKKAGPYKVLFAFGGYEITKKPTFSVSKPSFAALLFGKLTTDDTTDGVKPVGEPIEGNISQTKNDDGTYKFGFVPDKPGLYEFAPTVSDNPVFEEPLCILVTNPEKVKVSGPGATGRGACVGKPTEVVVDRTEAGPAPVEGVLSTPSGEKQPLDFKPKDEDKPDVLAATYTPDKPGNYQLDVTFDGEPIKDSPITAKVLDSSECRFEGPGLESGAIGEENIIDVFMPAIVPEEVTMEMMAPDHQAIPFEFFVDKIDDDHCQVRFIPETCEVCEGQLAYAGAPLGDPFKIPVGDPSKCKVGGPGIEDDKLPVGKETSFTVDSTEAGPGVPKVVITGPNDSKVEPVCTEEKPGVNKYTYTPEKGGPHEVAVLFGGHDIPGSPYTVPVCNPAGVKCAPVNPGEKKYHPGEEIVLAVDLKDAGEGDFSLGLVGPDNRPIVSEEAFIAIVPIEEAPIDGNTEIVELKPEGPKVGATVPYSIDTSGVQTGDKISGKVVGPFKNKKKVPKELLSDKITLQSLPTVTKDQPVIEPDVKENNKVYDVNFTPEKVGVYPLYIFLGDNLVNDMPSLISVCDADEVKITGPGLDDTESNTYPINTPLVWEADCTTAGPGKLTAFCAGPDDCSKKFKVAPVPGKLDCYTVTYKPKKAGPYKVLFAFGGYEITKKPTFSVSKPSFAALLFGKLTTDDTTDGVKPVGEPIEGNISQTKNDDGTYKFGFVPDKPGLYEFAPTVSDNPVFEEPLCILVTNPEKVKVSGPGATGRGASVGKPTEVVVDRTEAGPAPVEGVLSTPSGEKQPLDFKPKDEDKPDVLAATYTPDEPGNYQLDVTFDGEPIKDSPITAKVLDSSECRFEGPGLESGAIGEENIIDVFMPAIVPEEVTMEMMAPDHQEIPFEYFVDKIDDDHCQVKFTPETCEVCEGQLAYAGAPLGDPFKIPVGDPSKCKVSGPGIEDDKLPVGKETSFTVDSTEAGPGVPKVVITGPNDSKVEPVCTEEKPGVNKYTYTPEKGGPHEVAVLFGGHDVPGSPFFLPVYNPAGVKCAPVNPGEKKYHPGEPIVLAVDLKDAGEGDFSLGLVGPDNRPIVSEEAFIAIVPIEEAPIDGNTEVVELKPEGPKVGTKVPYSIDTSGVQTGDKISGKVVGPFKNKKKVPKELLSDMITLKTFPTVTKDQTVVEPDVEVNNKVYDVNFTPEKVGVYAMYIFLGDNLVNDTPCLLSVCDAEEVKLLGPGLGDTEGNAYPLKTPLIWEAYCTNAGPGKLTAFCAGPDNCSKKFKISPIPGKENCYYIEYIPKREGPYQMMFAYGDYEVPNKPTLNVTKPSYVALLAAHRTGLPVGVCTGENAAPVGGKAAPVGGKAAPVGENAVLQLEDKEEALPQQGKIESQLKDDGTCTFKFTPEKPGLYEFMPTLHNEPVFEEPLSILVTDPDKVKVFGPGITGKGVQIGKPTEVFFDRTDSGPGPVEAVLSTPSGEQETITFEPKDKEGAPNVLVGRYTPHIAGFHSLSFTFDDQKLPKSPLRVYVVNPEEFKLEGGGLKEATIGEVNIIDCLLENMPEEGVFSMVTEDKNGDTEPLDCEIIKVNDDKCCIEFIPDTEDACYAILQFNDVPIGNKIALAPNSIEGAEISGLQRCHGVVIGKERPFKADFSACLPQDGVLSVTIVQSDGNETEPLIIETYSKVYRIFFTPTMLGLLKIYFKYGEEQMVYTVFVIDPSAVICTGLDGGRTLVTEKQVFAIDTSAAGVGARLKIEIEGEGQADLSCKHMIDNYYSGVLSVVLAGTYYLKIFYGGYEIMGSSFECIFYRPDAAASLCQISDLASTPGKFMIDCRNAGGLGILEIAVYGAYVPARYIAVEHNGDYTFSIAYDIPDPVETMIGVKWHGEHLAGSPFKVVFKK